MPSPEAEAFRERVKQLMQTTLDLDAPLATRRVQYEAVMSRGHVPPEVQVEAVTVGTIPAEWVHAPQVASEGSCCICMAAATQWAPAPPIACSPLR
jgi:hypothetical protein